jgi:hypothetical protein
MSAECDPPKLVAQRCIGVLQEILDQKIPDPVGIKVTKWRSNPWSRGSHSFVPHAANDSCRTLLANPIDRRIYFAGEATSTQRPASVQGAWLSGIREARKLHAAFASTSLDADMIGAEPVDMASTGGSLRCNLCGLGEVTYLGGFVGPFMNHGTRASTPRPLWVHEKCAQNSLNVVHEDGSSQWYNVVRSCRSGVRATCRKCCGRGATLHCQYPDCRISQHVSCCIAHDREWVFEREDMGKRFFCSQHRRSSYNECVLLPSSVLFSYLL